VKAGLAAELGPAELPSTSSGETSSLRPAAAKLHWLDEGERGAWQLLRFMLWLATNVGRLPTSLLLYPIAAFYMAREPLARHSSRQFLERALGRPVTSVDIFRHFHCFATTILDRVYLLGGGAGAFRVDVMDEDGVLARSRLGQGSLLLGAHLGSFDMLRALAVDGADLKLKVLMREAHNARLTKLLAALNPAIAATVVPWRGPTDILKVKELLEAGYCVAILGDRSLPGERQVTCDFLGAPARLPLGPVQLAALLRTPCFFFSGVRRARRQYEARFELLADGSRMPPARSEEALAPWVQAYADRLAARARSAPYNWFNFFPFWSR
jgi:predicted LPLAT superfamily acyltransferase